MMAKFTSVADEATLGPLGSSFILHLERLLIPPCFPPPAQFSSPRFVGALLYYKRVAGLHHKCQRR